ncbi:MAG: pyruvate dehydrogenase complex dihydrolipoamide acetyltransferase [Gemmatimonadetes bacterium]|nr:pyruvate dehydrogenase complex dihydrolipoamide acetyltransferase [Gemmatimonadota bacterium]MYA40937.1 pyruvate dehydrogenase complex dihydrolipoamide acetyltransferase [Gemmatimonadota bacterium]MYE91750.1 pyruvate dehydrogenase complex dihydrolipoamide acetyltransferase [Gemmatimonadota bacterium]MYJ10711.1 pyruvate dehydrogenase complex dihydrolipoamide acetyltransferase [Gemmatimonadota bacterium]
MATRVHMEALSPTMEEGQVVTWLKAEGDPVAQGDILAEIETDKATMELVARGEGVLRKIFVAAGATAPVGDVIAVIGAEDEDIAALVASAGPAATAPAATAAEPAATGAEPGARAGPGPQAERATQAGPATQAVPAAEAEPATQTGAPPALAATPVGTTPAATTGRIKASPVARRLAGELGIDLATVHGSGPNGRVIKRDVEAAAAAAPTVAPAITPALPDTEFVDVPLTQMRKTVARRLAESLGPVPHFFLTVDVDMTRALQARVRVNELLAAQGAKASLNDMVIKAAAVALTHHPECNAWWQGDSIRRFNRVHMGVAVAVPDGLITPVVRDAHAKGLGQISTEIRELAGRAREKRLQPHEYTGSTFSISNLGMFGIEEFTAVINPPEAGIIAVGAIEDRPVVVDGQVVVQPRMRITMSCDHRVIDGAQGARFLATLKSFLEEPAAILI